MSTPSQSIMKQRFDGVVITDSLGRRLTLKSPNILDKYTIMSSIGEDGNNEFCRSYAYQLSHFAMIEGSNEPSENGIVSRPTSYAEFKIVLQRIRDEGFAAFMEYLGSLDLDTPKTSQEVTNAIKK